MVTHKGHRVVFEERDCDTCKSKPHTQMWAICLTCRVDADGNYVRYIGNELEDERIFQSVDSAQRRLE